MSLSLAYDRDGTLESMRINHELAQEMSLIDEISTAAKEMRSDAHDTEWTPAIEIPREKFRGAWLRKDGSAAVYAESDVTPEDEKAIPKRMKELREKAASDEQKDS